MKLFRIVAIWEGISYLLLLVVCMPLKYGFGIPEPTYPVGLAHGVLFVTYCSLVLYYAFDQKWSIKNTFLALVASLLPVAPFLVEKKLLRSAEQ